MAVELPFVRIKQRGTYHLSDKVILLLLGPASRYKIKMAALNFMGSVCPTFSYNEAWFEPCCYTLGRMEHGRLSSFIQLLAD